MEQVLWGCWWPLTMPFQTAKTRAAGEFFFRWVTQRVRLVTGQGASAHVLPVFRLHAYLAPGLNLLVLALLCPWKLLLSSQQSVNQCGHFHWHSQLFSWVTSVHLRCSCVASAGYVLGTYRVNKLWGVCESRQGGSLCAGCKCTGHWKFVPVLLLQMAVETCSGGCLSDQVWDWVCLVPGPADLSLHQF